jgi:hypothetical protein
MCAGTSIEVNNDWFTNSVNNGKKRTYPHPLALSTCKQDNGDASIFDSNNIRLRLILQKQTNS